jgi:histidinol-phosphate/aromatic aminotransferase/cobyric acid decarboxylase-like protein
MAKFMGQVRGGKVTFDPDRVVMSGGATGAQDTLAFCLADPGDAYLVPTPYYAAYVLASFAGEIKFDSNLSCRGPFFARKLNWTAASHVVVLHNIYQNVYIYPTTSSTCQN